MKGIHVEHLFAFRGRRGFRDSVGLRTQSNVVRGWGQYHRKGQNKGLFRQLDRWIRNRVRAYKRRRWRDRGRWKLFSAEELAKLGLFSLHQLIVGSGQLELFGGSP